MVEQCVALVHGSDVALRPASAGVVQSLLRRHSLPQQSSFTAPCSLVVHRPPSQLKHEHRCLSVRQTPPEVGESQQVWKCILSLTGAGQDRADISASARRGRGDSGCGLGLVAVLSRQL